MAAVHGDIAVASQASPVGAPALDPSGAPGVGETLYLIGRPPLKGFLRFVRSHAVKPEYEGDLIARWQAAQTIYAQLEHDEPGLAHDPPIGKLSVEQQPLLREFFKDPLVRGGFNAVPTEVAMVELDRLVVYQEHIDLTFARQLEQQLGPSPSDDVIFRTCLPFDHPQPPVTWARVHHDKFVFVSPSNDLRYLGAMPLEPRQIQDYPPPGSLVGVVGMAVGFGSNFLNAIYTEQRLILNNGSHRAYTLRKIGVTHVPCIVQHVGTRDELDVVAASEIRRDRDLYLKHARPPMLRDYFDPRLHVVMPVRRRLRQVTVRFEVEEDYVPAL
jgi:hypothetical protein